ncbi:M20 metallopeptidase family protein [Sporolactobacillus sp. KGMB 08714]|uniref:M20 metallopeptidase family protein n=1 Tax=Sporolactobacillus sp. KGMB 08714 TaxID=3064704 RepID=UPI002FBD65B9
MDNLDIEREIEQVKDELISWRRYLHQNPELSFKEYNTTRFICNLLESFHCGFILEKPTKTGVVARLKGDDPGKTVLYRADIDALPIHEKNRLSYTSQNDGVMHACGHDGHTAILLAVAKILGRHRESLKGEVRFVFQPAEEVGGARSILNTGILSGVDQAFALHLWSPLETGKYGIVYGPAMAAGEAFDIEIDGKGGHAGKVNETIDPVNIAVSVISTVNQFINRCVDPIAPRALSVTYFHGGSSHNVIPDFVKFGGTIRALDRDTLEKIKSGLVEVLDNIDHLYHSTYTLHFETDGLPDGEPPSLPVVNDRKATALVEQAIEKYLGSDKIVHLKPTLAGEDFAFYSHYVPAGFIFVGTKNVRKGTDYPHHSPFFNLDEDSLAEGVALFLSISKEIV